MTPSIPTHPDQRRNGKPTGLTRGFYKGLAIVGGWTVFGYLLVTIIGLVKVIP